jgi:hypothetical protein
MFSWFYDLHVYMTLAIFVLFQKDVLICYSCTSMTWFTYNILILSNKLTCGDPLWGQADSLHCAIVVHLSLYSLMNFLDISCSVLFYPEKHFILQLELVCVWSLICLSCISMCLYFYVEYFPCNAWIPLVYSCVIWW